jgi:hypothetical protein
VKKCCGALKHIIMSPGPQEIPEDRSIDISMYSALLEIVATGTFESHLSREKIRVGRIIETPNSTTQWLSLKKENSTMLEA